MSTMQKTTVSERIRRERADRGMTREAFAEFLGYAKPSSGVRTVARWESGRHVPTSAGAYRLAKATGRPVGFFLGDDPEEESDPGRLLRDLYAALSVAVGEAPERVA